MARERGTIGLFGRLGGGNIGNDAMLDTVMTYLRTEHPDAGLDFMCDGPEEMTRRYAVPAQHIHWLQSRKRVRSRLLNKALTALRMIPSLAIDTWRTITWVRRHDLVIVPGAGVLEGTLPYRAWELPYTMLVMAVAGRVFRVRTALICVGGSTVADPVNRTLLKTAARLVDYRSFRDDYSLEVGLRTGFAKPGDQAYADLAFALPVRSSAPAPAGSVGVGVMLYDGNLGERHRAEEIYAEYLAEMKQFVQGLLDSGRSVRLLIGDVLDDPTAREILDDATARWTGPGPVPVEYEPFSNFGELLDQVAEVRTVVAIRYHCVVAGLTSGRPTLAIGYGRKHDAVMAAMGLPEYVQDVRELDVERLIEQVGELEANEAAVISTLREKSAVARAELDRQFKDLSAVLFDADRADVT